MFHVEQSVQSATFTGNICGRVVSGETSERAREVREGLATGHRELLRGAQMSKRARRNNSSASGRPETPKQNGEGQKTKHKS